MSNSQTVAEGLWATDREIALAGKRLMRVMLQLPDCTERREALFLLRNAMGRATVAATRQLDESPEQLAKELAVIAQETRPVPVQLGLRSTVSPEHAAELRKLAAEASEGGNGAA